MEKILTIGIATAADRRARFLSIASGTLRAEPNDPKTWFPSVAELADVLSDENLALLKIIRERQPASLAELARAVGKPQSEVTRSVRAMSQFRSVNLIKHGRTVVPETAVSCIKLVLA